VDVRDIFNKPDNPNAISYPEDPARKSRYTTELIRKAFVWAREENPSQPITRGPWVWLFGQPIVYDLNRFMLEESDVISFHSYSGIHATAVMINSLRHYKTTGVYHRVHGTNARQRPKSCFVVHGVVVVPGPSLKRKQLSPVCLPIHRHHHRHHRHH